MPESYELLGLMSGSSLDGLDLVWCRFFRSRPDQPFSFEIHETSCVPFPEDLLRKLGRCREMTAYELAVTEQEFVAFSADCVLNLCQKTGKKPLAVASHGHTVFHQPEKGFTLQIGNGGLLYGMCGIPVVSDFRTVDVGLGGQGAPLVPGAEKELFAGYGACLNLGGICNISFPEENTIGYDVAPCNQLLNLVSRKAGKDFDEGGRLAAGGTSIPDLLEALDKIPFYRQSIPKSLSNEMVASGWIPLLESCRENPADILHTLCVHISIRISETLPHSGGRLLVSGGGVFNDFLMNQLELSCGKNWQVIRAEEKLASSKEALCFAWMGLKRLLNETNVPASVTGAVRDSISGALYGPAQAIGL